MGLFVGEQLGPHNYKPAWITRWLFPKGLSGNGPSGNGVGIKEKSQPVNFLTGSERKAWLPLGLVFLFRCYLGNFNTFRSFIIYNWREKFGHVKIADQKANKTAAEFKADLKEFTKDHPQIDILGVARMNPDWMFQGMHAPFGDWVVVIAKAMDYDELAHNLKGDFTPALKQVIGGYERTQFAAVDVANWMRKQGYMAKGFGGLAPVKNEWHAVIPPAIEAGIGQLAKNGSIISDKLGSCFRIATVMTTMPLVADQPREQGVDEFCVSCRKCTTDCPPGAIYDEKKLVRGVEKWYVDFDKCIPFMSENKACAICLSTCPWSRPGIAPSLSQKMLKKLARRETATEAAMAE